MNHSSCSISRGLSNHVFVQEALAGRMQLFSHWKGSISLSLEYGESTEFFVGQKVPLKIRPQAPEFLFNPRKELPWVILRWAIKIMAFDFDITFVKGNIITHVDALSRLRFHNENGEEHENSEDRIIQRMETDVLSQKTLNRETQRNQGVSSWCNG